VVESGVLAQLTSREREYRLTVASDMERVPALLDGSISAIEEAKAPTGLAAWNLTVRDRDQLNAVLDRLRRAKVLIESIEPVRNSLEEVFLRAIGGAQKDTAAEPPATRATATPVNTGVGA